MIENIKRKKAAAEVVYMRLAARIVDYALNKGIQQIAVGVRECDVAATIMRGGCRWGRILDRNYAIP